MITTQIIQEAVQAIRQARSQGLCDMLAAYQVVRNHYGFAASRETSREVYRMACEAAR